MAASLGSVVALEEKYKRVVTEWKSLPLRENIGWQPHPSTWAKLIISRPIPWIKFATMMLPSNPLSRPQPTSQLFPLHRKTPWQAFDPEQISNMSRQNKTKRLLLSEDRYSFVLVMGRRHKKKVTVDRTSRNPIVPALTPVHTPFALIETTGVFHTPFGQTGTSTERWAESKCWA